MTERSYTVHSGGRVYRVVMDAEMAASMDRLKAWWAEHGCKCDPCDTDKAITIPRGHTLDVLCGVCGGVIQVG